MLDPFAGTGTALAVAVEHGRKAIGFEITERFAKAAGQVLQQVNLALF